jgi:hypothetical protein
MATATDTDLEPGVVVLAPGAEKARSGDGVGGRGGAQRRSSSVASIGERPANYRWVPSTEKGKRKEGNKSRNLPIIFSFFYSSSSPALAFLATDGKVAAELGSPRPSGQSPAGQGDSFGEGSLPLPAHGLERGFLVLGPRRPPLLPGNENMFVPSV